MSSLTKVGLAASRVSYWVREYFGENAYPRYVAAWQASLSDTSQRPPLLTEREFFSQRLERTFGGDAPRCC